MNFDDVLDILFPLFIIELFVIGNIYVKILFLETVGVI